MAKVHGFLLKFFRAAYKVNTPLLISHEKGKKGPPFTQLFFKNFSPSLISHEKGKCKRVFAKKFFSHLKGMKNAKVKDDIENYLKCL